MYMQLPAVVYIAIAAIGWIKYSTCPPRHPAGMSVALSLGSMHVHVQRYRGGPVLQEELEKNKCRSKSIDVWQRGVDTEMFNPRFRSAEMRALMTDGDTDAPLLVYVGRLGAGGCHRIGSCASC